MATLKIMYWKEIPVQVQAEDASGQVSQSLDERFQQGVDAISMFDGSSGGDDYLMGWEWGEPAEVEGTAQEAVARMAERIEKGFPTDFVARIRDMHKAGKRDPRPGALAHWFE